VQAEKREATLGDVLDELRSLNSKVDQLDTDLKSTNTKVDLFNQRFSDYQQATQWVVQLAFTLIASATITVIVTSVLKR
jgi:uncharacterized protein YlxW (UPF0749 family)